MAWWCLKAPFEENWGYFGVYNDMTMDDYRNLNIHAISKEAFEKLWKEEIKLPFKGRIKYF